MYAKSLELHLLFTIFFFLEIQTGDDERVWILDNCVDFFLKIRVKIRIFVLKKLKFKTVFYKKKSENPTYSMGEGHSFSGIAHYEH